MLLLIFLAGGLLLVVPASAQSTEAANTKTGSILGTVVDMSDDPVPDATVVLQEPADDPLTVVTNEDGSFVFHDVTRELPIRSPSLLKDLQSGPRPLQSNPGKRKL